MVTFQNSCIQQFFSYSKWTAAGKLKAPILKIWCMEIISKKQKPNPPLHINLVETNNLYIFLYCSYQDTLPLHSTIVLQYFQNFHSSPFFLSYHFYFSSNFFSFFPLYMSENTIDSNPESYRTIHG